MLVCGEEQCVVSVLRDGLMPRMKALPPVTTTACPPMILGRRPKPCRSALAILNPTRTRFAIACRRHAYARGLAPSLAALRSDITRMAGVFVRSDCDQFTAPAFARAARTAAPASSASAGRNPFHASALLGLSIDFYLSRLS